MIGAKQMPSRAGGVDVVINHLATGLAHKGNDVTVFVHKKKGFKRQRVENLCSVKSVFTIDKKGTAAIVYSFFATLKGLFGKFDILHFHASGNTLFLWMTKYSKKRIIVTCHGIDWKRSKFKGLGQKILIKSEKLIVKYANEIITLCHSDHDYFQKTYNKKTHLIPNGFERFELLKADIITKKYGLQGDDYFLFLARIVPEKGLHYLIKAYKNSGISQKLVVAGGGSHSSEYYDEMVRLAEGDQNIIFTGFVQGMELEELESNAYCYVLPSDIEGMPMSLLEALGHQRICLVSDIPENAVDLENSYVFRRGDITDLKNKLVEISQARKKFKANNNLEDWDTIVDKTEKIYKEK